MEKSNFEGFFPFVIIILIYLITNLRNRKKKKEEEQKRQRRSVPAPQPVFKPRPPPAEPKQVPIIKRAEEEKSFPEQSSPLKQTRIQNVVQRLHSKKDLIIASEILRRKDDCF